MVFVFFVDAPWQALIVALVAACVARGRRGGSSTFVLNPNRVDIIKLSQLPNQLTPRFSTSCLHEIRY